MQERRANECNENKFHQAHDCEKEEVVTAVWFLPYSVFNTTPKTDTYAPAAKATCIVVLLSLLVAAALTPDAQDHAAYISEARSHHLVEYFMTLREPVCSTPPVACLRHRSLSLA